MDKALLTQVLIHRNAYDPATLAIEILDRAAMICNHRWAVYEDILADWLLNTGVPLDNSAFVCGKCGIRRDRVNER